MAHPLLNRLIRVFNLLVLLALAAGAGLVWWYAVRPLPKTSGTVDAPVSAPITVARDSVGVPHIRAASLDDVLFAQGYVTAQDRLFQMDGLRRLAGGTLAEVFGARLLDADRDARRYRMRRLAEAAYLALPAADRAALAAYARGVNHFISTHLGNLPVEFTLVGYQPRPWSAVDSLLIGLQMYRTLTDSWRQEIIKRDLLAAGDRAKVDFLFAPRTGGEVQPGSNGWALAGSRTATGKPILSNDMHLEWALPGLWYMARLEAPGLEVAGVALPGLPGIVVGHNRRIAWGITNLQFDVQDLYREKFDDRSGRYLFRGQVEQARLEREFIEVKDGKRVELAQWVTLHGPLLVAEGPERLSLRWAAAEMGAVEIPLLDIDRAQNWDEFTRAISRFKGPGSNFVYADVDGNIGYHAAGMLPIRRGSTGDVPADGSSGENEWDGFIPFERLPSAFNPPSGMIVTANQNPFPAGYPYPVNGNFAPYYRARQIRDRLQSRGRWTPQETLALQSDVYSGFSRFLAQAMVAAYDKRNSRTPSLDEAANLLRQWNGQMDSDQAAPLIAALAWPYLRTAVVENAAPGKGQAYEYPIGPAVVEKLFRERPAGWFRDYDETLLRVFIDSVEEAARMQGRDPKRWLYGAWFNLGLNHPVVHNVPWLGRYFDLRPVGMSGSGTTVKQTTRRVGPSMRMNADLGDWDRSLLNIPIGQSGQILSGHYRDQWERFNQGLSYPMRWGKAEAKDTLELRPGK